ncbi:uncharacterized protein ACBT44_018015 isoform 1-T1 [Syngnathus typhle]
MSKLLNLTPVKKSSDVAALRHLYDECEIQIRSLESLGVQSDTYGCLLCPVLLQLVPEDIALAYTRQPNSTNDWKVQELIKFLQNEVQSRERALQLTRPGQSSKASSPQHKRGRSAWESGGFVAVCLPSIIGRKVWLRIKRNLGMTVLDE